MNNFDYLDANGSATAIWGRSYEDSRYWYVFFHDKRFNPGRYTCVTDDFGYLVPVTK